MSKYNPKPLIESHYHIESLIEFQDKKAADRNYYRDREKLAEERQGLIKDAKLKDIKEFWCTRCKRDFVGEAILQVEIDWSCPTQNIAFYKTKCFCGTWAMRYVTDRHSDPYWFRSRKVAGDRGNHALDILQPWETNYQMLYGRKNHG